MPSPFPGMDPYIEQMGDWVGFHNTFIVHCSELLNEVLPEQYVATTAARIHSEPAAVVSAGAAATTMQPVTLPQEDPWADEVREAFIEIVRVPGEELVTTIELLSPTNKIGGSPDRAAYLLKRRQLLHDGVNVVDLDLLLSGERLPMLEPLPAGDYFAFVSRAARGRTATCTRGRSASPCRSSRSRCCRTTLRRRSTSPPRSARPMTAVCTVGSSATTSPRPNPWPRPTARGPLTRPGPWPVDKPRPHHYAR